MKKENGLKRTWQHFTKRASTLILAGAVAISILPMAVSAADETGGTKFWQTIVDLNMDGFEKLRSESVTSDTATVDGRTYGVSFCWGTNGKRVGNSRAFKNGEDTEVSAAYTKGAPEGVGNYVLKHHGACTSANGWVWTSSDSGWAFSNLWDANTVSVGDTVKISAQVYPVTSGMKKQKYNTSKNIYEPEGGSANGKGAMRLMSGTHSALTDVTGDQWNELNLEFAITADDVASGKVQVDSGAPAADAVYATRWVVGSVKVELLGEAGGSYTFQNGKKWEQLSQVTMDDYEEVEGSSGGISWWGGKKSDNTGWLSAEAGTGKYAEFKTNYGHQRIHQGTGIRPISGEDGVTAPAIPGAGAITNVFKLNRAWSEQAGSWPAGPGKGAPDSRINISGLFDKTKVQVGDTVKITAWVMGVMMHDATTAADSMKPDDAATVTMWLSDKARSGDVATNGPAADYNLAKPANASETASYDDMKQGEWKEISLTYTVTEGNKDVTGIGLNSDKMGSDKVAAFPLYLYVAGVKAEKLVDDPTQTAGTVSGTITAQIDDAAGTKIVVAAYKSNELLGCDIVDADAATTKYSFSIADAYGTDKVIAYIWKLDNANPVLAPIPLTAN